MKSRMNSGSVCSIGATIESISWLSARNDGDYSLPKKVCFLTLSSKALL